MAGNRDIQQDGLVPDPLSHGLFRGRALAHYEQWGGEPAPDTGYGGGSARQPGRVVAVLPAAQAGRVRQGVTVRVAVPGRTVAVPLVLRGGGRVLSAAQVMA